ncbi:MAG: 16S rRNA processing protein RimM [Alphaproteobacteria bacterium]|nr:16S rRNA processing protein RimM [Alphaproteobacteria bacterium]
MKEKILVGQFLKPHGLKGGIKVRSFMATPKDLFSHTIFDEEGKVYKLETYGSPSPAETFYVWVNAGMTREEVEKLQGKELFMDRDLVGKLEKDEFFYEDLKGLDVYRQVDQKKIGTVFQVHNYGAGDILEIEALDGKKYMISFQNSSVPIIDLENNRIEIDDSDLL